MAKAERGKYSLPFYGWIVTIVCFTMNMTFGVFVSFSDFFPSIMQEFQLSHATTASIYSVAEAAYVLGLIFTAGLVDRYDNRIIAAAGALLASSGLILSSYAANVFELYLSFGAMGGLGWGFLIMVATAPVPKWFIKRRGIAVGIMATGSGAGTLVFPPIAAILISDFSYRISFFVLGLLVLGIMLTSSVLVRNTPESMGLKPYGCDESISVSPLGASDPEGTNKNSVVTKEAIRTRAFWIVYFGFFLGALCLQSFVVFVVPFGQETGGLSLPAASLALTLEGTGSVVGRIGTGYFSDRFLESRDYLVLAYFLLAFSTALIPLIGGTMIAIYFFSLIIGLSYGGFVSGNILTTSERFGTKSFGRVWGMIATAFGIGGIVGPIISGFVYDSTQSFSDLFLLTAVLGFCAALVVLIRRSDLTR